jgi:hypothetical protein
MSTYTDYHRNYYLKHKDEINERRRAIKSWNAYNHANKVEIAARQRERYHAAKRLAEGVGSKNESEPVQDFNITRIQDATSENSSTVEGGVVPAS